jgi:hypothetical protein
MNRRIYFGIDESFLQNHSLISVGGIKKHSLGDEVNRENIEDFDGVIMVRYGSKLEQLKEIYDQMISFLIKNYPEATIYACGAGRYEFRGTKTLKNLYKLSKISNQEEKHALEKEERIMRSMIRDGDTYMDTFLRKRHSINGNNGTDPKNIDVVLELYRSPVFIRRLSIPTMLSVI